MKIIIASDLIFAVYLQINNIINSSLLDLFILYYRLQICEVYGFDELYKDL